MIAETCLAPDCDNDAKWLHEGYCSNVCWNVGIKVAAKQVASGYEDVSDDEIGAIRENVESNHELIQDKIEAATEATDP